MADENLRILLSASLNIGKSIGDINDAIKVIEKHPSLQKLKIKIEADENFVQSINKFISAAEKLKKVSDEQNKVVSETIDVFKKLDGSITTVTQKILKSGEVIQKTKNVHDENKKSIEKETEAIEQQKISLEELLDENKNFNKLKNRQTPYDSEGKIIGYTNTYSDGNSLLRVNLDSEENVIKYTIIDRVETEKLIKTKEELRKKLLDLAQIGALSKQRLGNVARYVNSAFDDESINQAKESISSAKKASDERIKFIQNEQKVSKSRAEQMAKWIQDTNRAHYDAFLEKEKREKHLYNLIQDRVRAEKLAYEEESKRSLASSRIPSGRYIGEIVGNIPTIDRQNIKDLQNYVKSIGGVEAELTSMSPKVDNVHGKMQELHYRVKEGGKYWRNYVATLVETSGQTHLMDKGLSDLTHRQLGFSEATRIAITRIAQWGFATTAVYGSLRQFKEGITYIYELDNAMNEVRIVTGKTQEQVKQLASEYNKTAREMSVTTAELAKTSADLFRQGLDDSQVKDRMDAIVKYAKISSISLEDSNKIITATMNATGESAQKVIDIFSYLGDVTASGADEIGTAMQRVASTNEGVGVSFEKAASWLAVISSKTRESAAVIGNALKSVESRYTSIKETGFNSEDATGINEVTKALTAAGVQATTTDGQLRNFADVMDDLGKKYSSLDDKTKNYIATTLGGTYQMNRLRALLNGYQESLDLYTKSLNQAGIANQKFAIYQESSAAKLDKFKASWEGFWQGSLDSSTIKMFLSASTQLVDHLNNVGNVMILLTGIFVAFKYKAIDAFVTGIKTSITSLFAFKTATESAAVAVTGFQRALGIIGLVITAGSLLYTIFNQVDNATEKLNKTIDDNNKKYSENANQINSVLSYYKENHNAINSNAQVKEQLFNLQNRLISTFGKEAEGIDLVNGKYDEQIDKLKEIDKSNLDSKIKNNQIVVDAILEKKYSDPIIDSKFFRNDYRIGSMGVFGDTDLKLDEYYKKMLDIKTKLENYNTEVFAGTNLIPRNHQEWADALKAVQDRLAEIKPLYDQINAQENDKKEKIKNNTLEQTKFNIEQQKMFDKINSVFKDQSSSAYEKNIVDVTQAIKNTDGKNLSQVIDKLKELPEIQIDKGIIDQLSKLQSNLQNVKNSSVDLDGIQKEVIKKFEATAEKVKPLNDALDTLSESHQLTSSAIMELVKKYPELYDKMTVENGQLVLTKEAIADVRDAKIKEFNISMSMEQDKVDAQRNALTAKLSMYSSEVSGIKSVADAKALELKILQDADAAYHDAGYAGPAFIPPDYGDISKTLEAIGNAQEKIDSIKKLVNDTKLSFKDSKNTPNQKSESNTQASLHTPTDFTKEEIDAINNVISARDRNIKSLEKQVQSADKLKDYNKSIALTNQLLTEQKGKIDDVNKANDKIKERADNYRKSYESIGKQFAENGVLFDQWFNSEGNASDAYIDTIKKIEKSIFNIEGDGKNLTKSQNEQITALDNQKKLYEDIFKKIQSYKKAWDGNLNTIQGVNDSIDTLNSNIEKLNEESHKKFVDETNKSLDTVKKAYIDAYKQVRDVEDKRHKDRMDNLNDEMNKFQDSIDLIQKQIDRSSATDDFNSSLKTLQDERQKLQVQLNKESLDDSIEGKARAKQTSEEIAAKNAEIEKLQKDRTKQVRKDALQDALDIKKKEIDSVKKSEDEKHQKIKDNLDTVLNDEKIWTKLSEDVFAGHTDAVTKTFETLGSKLKGIITDIGQGLKSNITDPLNGVGNSLIKASNDVNGGYYAPANDNEKYYIGQMKSNSQSWFDNPSKRSSYEEANRIYGKIIGATYDNGAWTKNGLPLYHDGGEVGGSSSFKNWLHKKLNLNSNELPAILKKGEFVLNNPMDAISGFMSKLQLPDFSGMKMATAGAGDVHYNIDVKIDKLSGDKSGADLLFSEIKKGIQSGRYR